MIRHPHTGTKRHLGFTFIELITTLAIAAILISVAIPSFQHLVLSNQSKTAMTQITNLIRLARNIAVTKATSSTLCPSTDGLKCSPDVKGQNKESWPEGVLLFTDKNTNNKVDGSDQIIRFQKLSLSQGSLKWSSLRNYIQFSARGFPRGTVGSFTYCPHNKDNTFAKSLSLSFQGKLRQGRDLNDDGIIENGQHKNIVCT